VRLTDEKIADVKEYLNRSIKVTASSLIPQLSKYGIDLIDTIEALQQENEQLKADCDRMLGEVQELTMEYNHFKERLQISPYGDDKIDELDEALENCKFQYEQLKQENEQLQAQLDEWKYEAKCHMDEVIARDKEIEKLRAHVARMRELLTKAYDEIEKYKCLWKGSKPSGCDCPKPTALQDEIEQTLAEIDKAIGGEAGRGKEG
jgi:uncharacterized protein (DUF3084 family)